MTLQSEISCKIRKKLLKLTPFLLDTATSCLVKQHNINDKIRDRQMGLCCKQRPTSVLNLKAKYKCPTRATIKQPRPFSELLCRNVSPWVIRLDTATLTGHRALRGRGKNTVIGAYHRNRGFPAAEGHVNTSSRQPVHFLSESENKPSATFAALSARWHFEPSANETKLCALQWGPSWPYENDTRCGLRQIYRL